MQMRPAIFFFLAFLTFFPLFMSTGHFSPLYSHSSHQTLTLFPFDRALFAIRLLTFLPSYTYIPPIILCEPSHNRLTFTPCFLTKSAIKQGVFAMYNK